MGWLNSIFVFFDNFEISINNVIAADINVTVVSGTILLGHFGSSCFVQFR